MIGNKRITGLKKMIATLLVALMLFVNGGASFALAFDFPEAPSAPTPPPAPTAPPAPAPEVTPPPAPTAPPAPSESTPTPVPTSSTQATSEPEVSPESSPVSSPEGTSSEEPQELNGVSDGGNVGDTSIDTGDATSTGAIVTNANTNTSATLTGGAGGISVINSDNGTDSTNSGSASVTENNLTFQENSAVIVNDLDSDSISGQNDSSKNVGNTEISTGDASATGTIITAVNTNVDGVAVAEFNVVDDQMGDIILDFGVGCLIGCDSGSLLAQNSGNGSDSTNTSNIDSTVNNGTFQENDATVENNMTLLADSGTNYTDSNTNGDSTIETGDAYVSGNALTFANNNVEGNVIYAVVNIFGNLIGDIIVPEGFFDECCLADTSVENSGNGSGSTNTGSVNQTTNDLTYQFNNVELDNNLILDANSGGNETSGNTGGDSSIETGDTTIDAQVLNVANSNLSGGNWWLVLVNEAGNWIGRIVGSDGSYWGGSEGLEFAVNEFGEVTVVNSDNGSGSTNTGSIDQTTNNTVMQLNDAHITNNFDLTANTGNNSASSNTGGDSSIKTGDAKVIANIVNFVNNNITGGGKLLVTIVNVFGSWFGDFVGPGFEKENQGLASNQEQGIGGPASSTSQGSSQNGGSQASSSSTPSVQGLLASNDVSFSFDFGGSLGGSQVSGESSGVSGSEGSGDNAINVNLAWGLPFLFVGGVVSMIVRRRHAI